MTKRSTVLTSVQAAGKGVVIQITGDGESAKRALEMVQEELRRTEAATRRAKEEAGGLSHVFERAAGALETVGLYMGVREVLSGIRELVGGSLELGETLEKASVKTGLAVETLSVLHYATAITGDSFEGLTRALTKMNVTIGKAADGDAKASASIQALGLNAKELSQRTDGAEVAFDVFMKRLAATEGSIERTNLATRVMSKAGAEQIPVILKMAENWDALRQKAQEAGVLLDGETAKKLADTNQRLNDLKQHAMGAGLAFTEGLAPGLGQVFSIITGGRGSMDALTDWGNRAAKGIAFVAEVAYSAASALEFMFSQAELGTSTAAGRKDDAASRRLQEQAEKFHDIAFGKTPLPTQPSFLPEGGGGPKGPGFDGAPVVKPGKSDNPIAQAAVALAQEQAKAVAAVVRASDQAQLAELETQHRLLLRSDLAYYQEKLDIANKGFAAEQAEIDQKTKTLEASQKKQHADKLLKRDKDGNSAEELKTARELVQLKEKQAEVDAKKMEAESRYTGEVGAMNNAAELAGLRAAAALERERGQGIEAQIKLLEREHQLEAQKSTLAGGSEGDAQAIRDAGVLAVQKLKLKDVEDDIAQVEQTHRRAVEDTTDAVEKGDLSKRAAAQRTKAANVEEMENLRALAQQYKDLADAIGDPTLIQKSKDLDQQLANLGRTDRRGTFGKEVQDGLQGITTSLIDSAARGKQSFAEMTRSILDDLDRLALKMAEEKFILPLFEQAFAGAAGAKGGATGGAGGPGIHALDSNGVPTGNGGGFGAAFGLPKLAPDANIGGGGGPSVYKPPQEGSGGGASGFFKGLIGVAGRLAGAALSKKGGDDDDGDDDDDGGKAPVVNIHNHSSQAVTAGSPQVTYDSDLKQFIIDVVLQDHLNGGQLSQV